MKKKLSVATVLILLLAVCLTMLVGCDEMFTKNEERDATQVVAGVEYKGQTASIYKYELEASFNSYAYLYVNYYGMSNQEAANYILRSLAQQKLLTLYAKEKVTSLLKLDSMPADVKDLLTTSEYDKAVRDTNKSLLTSLKSIVENLITDDNYNTGDTDTPDKDKDEDDEDVTVTKPVYVRFESNGGSEVERQRIQEGTKAKKPADPTKEGYTFYGWYENKDFSGDKFEDGVYTSGEFDFDTKINNSIVLYAKWVEFTEARTEIPEVEEEDEEDKDYDPDNDDPELKISPMFFSKEYQDTIEDEFKDEDFVEKIDSKLNKTLADYIEDGLAELKENIMSNTFKKSADECYEYYLGNQMDTILVTKMQRLIGKTVSVTEAEIEAEFNAVVKKNKQTFSGSNADSAYSSALTGSLDSTYFHTSTEDSYGFVINILLKLDDDSLKVLTDMCKANPANSEAIKIVRNRLISDMEIRISNPKYKSSEIVKDENGDEIKLRDPMTDPANPYNNVGKTENKDYQVEGGNNYNQILSFVKNEDGEFEIKFNATEHPAMAYMLEKVPAFDKDGKVGIIHQIHNSLNQVMNFVDAGELSKQQGVYWLRQVATKWLYLVGDDSGAVTDSSNNNGLGYLITPEGKDSGYLEDFTKYARDLVKKGTGAFATDAIGADTFLGAVAADGTMAGNGVAYVVADSFIGNGTTNFDNAYAGVFVLLNSYTAWDESYYGKELPSDGTLPLDYIMSVSKDEDDNKTIKQLIEDSILEAKKTAAYNLDVNTMGLEYMDKAITYYEKTYKSLWKNKD